MAIIEVVKLDFSPGEFVKKFGVTASRPDGATELATWSQLIVNESQEAFLYRQGALDGPFPPGRHVLSTENIPVIGKVLNLPFSRSPFTAEVWFVNRAMSLDVKWGTPEPIKLTDPVHEILIPVTAYGQFGLQIIDGNKFLVKLVGTLKKFDADDICSYFKGMVLAVSKSILAKEIIEKKISVLEISTRLVEISDAIQNDLKDKLAEFGLKLVNFYVNTIDVVDSDLSIETLQKAMAERARMKIIGFNYQQMRSLDILETAAGNEGTAAGLMGAGMGLGLGVGVGGSIGNSMGDVVKHLNPQGATPTLGMEEKIKQLQALDQLMKDGILTEDEFVKQKQIILGS
jgi:membrane protease subunit (stomatin/prohibitin family)